MIAESTVITGGIRRSDDHDLQWMEEERIDSTFRWRKRTPIQRGLSRGDVFSTQENYLVEMYSKHRLSHGDVFNKQAYYFAEKTFQR